MLQPAGRRSKRKPEQDDQPPALDPIAVTLALWLGIVASATGLIRLEREAVAEAALAEAAGEPAPNASQALNPHLAAFGG